MSDPWEVLGIVQLRFVVAHPGFRQRRANLDFHLHRLMHQKVAVAQGASSLTDRHRGQVSPRQKIAAQTVANLVGVDVVVLLFRGRDGP